MMIIRNPIILPSLYRNIYIFTLMEANYNVKSFTFLIEQEKDFPMKMFPCVCQEDRKIPKTICRVQWDIGLIYHELRSSTLEYIQDESHFRWKYLLRNLKAHFLVSKLQLKSYFIGAQGQIPKHFQAVDNIPNKSKTRIPNPLGWF